MEMKVVAPIRVGDMSLARYRPATRIPFRPLFKASSREIRFTHVRIIDQLAPASLDRHGTRFQEIGVIAHVERGRRILLHHENGGAGRANVGDNVERALDDIGGESERRFIE